MFSVVLQILILNQWAAEPAGLAGLAGPADQPVCLVRPIRRIRWVRPVEPVWPDRPVWPVRRVGPADLPGGPDLSDGPVRPVIWLKLKNVKTNKKTKLNKISCFVLFWYHLNGLPHHNVARGDVN